MTFTLIWRVLPFTKVAVFFLGLVIWTFLTLTFFAASAVVDGTLTEVSTIASASTSVSSRFRVFFTFPISLHPFLNIFEDRATLYPFFLSAARKFPPYSQTYDVIIMFWREKSNIITYLFG